MSRKRQSDALHDHRIAVIVVKTSEENYNSCLRRLQAMEIPKGWQVEFRSVEGVSAAGARSTGMKAVEAPLKAYIEDRLQLRDRGVLRKAIEAFTQDKEVGMVGLMGTNEVPTSGIAQNSWHLLGERENKNGTMKGEKVSQITDCLAIDGVFMAVRGDTVWHEESYRDDYFYDTAQTLDMRRKGYRTVLIPQDEAPLLLDASSNTTTEVSQKSFLDEYSKDIFPLVSIIIPTYCRPDYFEEALDSALGQTYRNIEVFITDNSPDTRTADLVARKYAVDARVHYEHHPEFKGAVENWRTARNYNNEKAEYVQWLMDDDILLPHKLEVMVDCYRRHPNVTLVTSYRKLIDKDGKEMPDQSFNAPVVSTDTLISGKVIGRNILENMLNFIGEPTTVLIKKKYLHDGDLGWTGKEGKALISDFPTWLNLCAQGDVIYLREAGSMFRFHGGNGQNTLDSLYSGLVCWSMMISHAWETNTFLETPQSLNTAIFKWYQEVVRIMRGAAERKNNSSWDVTLREHICSMSELFLEAGKGIGEALTHE